MKNPQTLADKLNKEFSNKKLEQIAKRGCCAFVLLWCLGIEPDDTEAILTVADMIDEGSLEEDCTVLWAKAIRNLTGRTLKKIDFVDITSIKGIKERTPVLYKKKPTDKGGHWVGVENGKIKFNPLNYSVCVSEGKPAELRKLVL